MLQEINLFTSYGIADGLEWLMEWYIKGFTGFVEQCLSNVGSVSQLLVQHEIGHICDTPPTTTSTVKHSITSWSFWVQKHVCGIKIDTPDGLSGHHWQISEPIFFLKKKRGLRWAATCLERPLSACSSGGHSKEVLLYSHKNIRRWYAIFAG